jgi:transcriptional regulator with XRE-family HTH domain
MIRSPRVLIAARVLAGLTQSELAAAAGIAVSVLQAIEQGQSDPKLSTINAILSVLRSHGVDLVQETDRVAWGAVVNKGSDAEAFGLANSSAGRAAVRTGGSIRVKAQTDPREREGENQQPSRGIGRNRRHKSTASAAADRETPV